MVVVFGWCDGKVRQDGYCVAELIAAIDTGAAEFAEGTCGGVSAVDFNTCIFEARSGVGVDGTG